MQLIKREGKNNDNDKKERTTITGKEKELAQKKRRVQSIEFASRECYIPCERSEFIRLCTLRTA